MRAAIGARRTTTEWSAAIAQQLLARYGVVTREVGGGRGARGGFSAVYDVLKAMEEARPHPARLLRQRGRRRRSSRCRPRSICCAPLREPAGTPEVVHLAATDPANPYGAILRWPSPAGAAAPNQPRLARSVGASVILVNGALAAYLGKAGRTLTVFLPEAEPQLGHTARAIAARLAGIALTGEGQEGGLLIAEVNGAAGPRASAGALSRRSRIRRVGDGHHVPRRK